MHNIVSPHQLLRQRLEDIQCLQRGVGSVPFLGWVLIGGYIEACKCFGVSILVKVKLMSRVSLFFPQLNTELYHYYVRWNRRRRY